MSLKLYIDGCSLTYGHGLPREQSLGHLFHELGQYQVTDMSRPGKSNLAIANDVYLNAATHDVFVIGWTFSSRFGIKYNNENLDFFVGWHGNGAGFKDEKLDQAFTQVYKYFYTVFGPPYSDQLSNMLVDTTMAFLQDRKAVAFSWEPRDTNYSLLMPYFGPEHRLLDGHLTAEGTRILYDNIQKELDV